MIGHFYKICQKFKPIDFGRKHFAKGMLKIQEELKKAVLENGSAKGRKSTGVTFK